MTEFRYDDSSQQIVVTLAGNQPLNADDLIAEAEQWLQQQKSEGQLDGYQLHPRRIKQLVAQRRTSNHLDAFSQAPLTFTAATTARHNGDIQLSPVDPGSAFAFMLSVAPYDSARQQTSGDNGFLRFAANIADLARSQGFAMGNRSQLHAAYRQWRAGGIIRNRPIGKPYDIHQSRGKGFRLFSHQVRPEVYLVIWDAKLLTDHEALTKMIKATQYGVAKVNGVGNHSYQLLDGHMRAELERAIHGPERLGVDLPLSILVALDPSFSDQTDTDYRDPGLSGEQGAAVAPAANPKQKTITPAPLTRTVDREALAIFQSAEAAQQDAPMTEAIVKDATTAPSAAIESDEATGITKTDGVQRVEGDINHNFPQSIVRGSLHVTGSIEQGVTLTVTGDLMVDGAIGQATLKVMGNLIVNEAVVSGQDNTITVEGHLIANAVANSRLFVHGNIIVATSIIHTDIEYCRNLIIKDLGHGLLAGGKVTVRDHMICGNIGFPKGDGTKLIIGAPDLPATRHLQQLEERKKALDTLKSDWLATLDRCHDQASSVERAKAEHRLARIEDMLSGLEGKLSEALAKHQKDQKAARTDLGKAHLMVAANLWDNVALYLAGKGYKLPRAVKRVQIAAGMNPPVQKLDFDDLKAVYLQVCGNKH